MDIKTLKVGIIVKRENFTMLGTIIEDSKINTESIELAPKFMESLLKNKQFFLEQEKGLIKLYLTDLEVTNSISDRKNFNLICQDFKADNTKINDLIRVVE